MSLLLVEDNARLSASLVRGLGESGFEVQAVSTGAAALERIARPDTDAVVLDLGLPDLDGLEVLVRARTGGVLAPILVLTARDAVASRVTALERGADDYLVKPFAFEELVARLRALLRRAAAPRWASLSLGDLRVEPDSLSAQAGADRVLLSPREHALLQCLVRRGGAVATRREILREVFGYDFEPGTNLVEVHVAHLRRKLAVARTRIETVRGRGYRVASPTEDPGDG